MTRGLINDNWFNVKCEDLSDPWLGTVGYDGQGHVIFSHPIFGIRAVCRDLAAKYLGGRRTVRQTMERYAERDDTLGSLPGQPRNDPDAAAEFICAEMARRLEGSWIGPDADCELFKPDGMPRCIVLLRNFLEILFIQENGRGAERPGGPHLIRAGIEFYIADFGDLGHTTMT